MLASGCMCWCRAGVCVGRNYLRLRLNVFGIVSIACAKNALCHAHVQRWVHSRLGIISIQSGCLTECESSIT
eukprot:jgi/Chrzof1/14327/UNPLg00600.t1